MRSVNYSPARLLRASVASFLFSPVLLVSPVVLLSAQAAANADSAEQEQVVGWPIDYAGEKSCSDAELTPDTRPVFCIGTELYAAYSHSWAEDANLSHDRSKTDYLAVPIIKVAMPEYRGWMISGVFEWEAGDEGMDTSAAYIALNRDWFTVYGGYMEVGSIDQGNEYTTELGAEVEGDYGNREGEQAYLALAVEPMDDLTLAVAYGSRENDLEDEAGEGDISSVNFVLEWEVASLAVGMEYEIRDYRGVPASDAGLGPSAEYAYGLGLAYDAGLIVPFLNVGYIVENSEDWDDRLENTEVNLGLDVVLQEDFGFTVGYERRSSNEKQDDGSATDAIDTAYISAKKSLDYAEVGLAYWWYDHNVEQGQDNVSSSVTLEVALAF